MWLWFVCALTLVSGGLALTGWGVCGGDLLGADVMFWVSVLVVFFSLALACVLSFWIGLVSLVDSASGRVLVLLLVCIA